MSELFPEAHSLSPRLEWMKRYGVSVEQTKFDQQPAYVAHDDIIQRYGATEDDALFEFAKAKGILLWNEEQPWT